MALHTLNYISHIYFIASYPNLPIDRTSPRPTRRQYCFLAHSLACPIPRRARGELIVCVVRNKLSRVHSLLFRLGMFPFPRITPSSDRCPHPLSMILRHILPSSLSRHLFSPFPSHLPDNPVPSTRIQPLNFVLARETTAYLRSTSCPNPGRPLPPHGITLTHQSPLQILTRALPLVPNLTSPYHLWTIQPSLP